MPAPSRAGSSRWPKRSRCSPAPGKRTSRQAAPFEPWRLVRRTCSMQAARAILSSRSNWPAPGRRMGAWRARRTAAAPVWPRGRALPARRRARRTNARPLRWARAHARRRPGPQHASCCVRCNSAGVGGHAAAAGATQLFGGIDRGRRLCAIAGPPGPPRWRARTGIGLADRVGARGCRCRIAPAAQPPRLRWSTMTCPCIFIGNGSGFAGLRAHLRERARRGHGRNWLVFGERNAAHDAFCAAEIAQWQAAGALERVDLVFSRDQAQRLYVQDQVARGGRRAAAMGGRCHAVIYVCGSLEGMAPGVDSASARSAGCCRPSTTWSHRGAIGATSIDVSRHGPAANYHCPCL
jgi:hypothetical protein